MMRPRAKATKDPKFLFVFSQRRAMRLKRLSLPTSCSMRARARSSAFGKKAGRFLADDLTGITGQMLRSRAAERLALASYPLSPTAARRDVGPKIKQDLELRAVAGLTFREVKSE